MVRELFHPWLDNKCTILLNRKCLKLGNLRIELANVYAILFELMRKRYVLERHQFLRVIPACKFAYIIQRHDKCLPCLKYTPTVSTDFQSCFFRKQTFVREKHGYFFSPLPPIECLSLEGSRFEKLLINGVFRITIEFVIFPSHCISARVTRKFWSR